MSAPFQFHDLKRKTLVLTGMTKGIGKALMPGLLSQGLKLVLISFPRAEMEKVCREIGANPDSVSLYECDLASPESVAVVGQKILSEQSAIDAILHNAGIDPREQFVEADAKGWNHVFQVNLFAAVELTRALLPRLQQSENGRVIFTGSVMDALGGARLTAYAASKGALCSLTRSLAHELKGSRITVNCVVPGAIAVEKEKRTDEGDQRLISWQSVPRRLVPNDLLGPICLLLSQAGGGISGQNLVVDGGMIHPLADAELQASVLES